MKIGKRFWAFLSSALSLARSIEADAVLLLADTSLPWDDVLTKTEGMTILAASNNETDIAAAQKAGVKSVLLNLQMDDAPVTERLTQALLEGVADELLAPGASVVALYSGFDPDEIDSISCIHLTEHLGRLTARDLQALECQVPLDTLKVVVDLAVEIGREGREGKPVGTLFVIGDHRKVMEQSHGACFEFVRGYTRKERSLFDARVREGIKEIAQLDGAFVVASDGVVEGSCRIIDTAPVEITLTTGLGARHWAAAAITKNTKTVAVVVSESSGTVRIFRNGEVVLRIEPFRRPMKWRQLEIEAPHPSTEKAE